MPPLNYSHRLLKNIHIGLSPPASPGETFLVGGDYRYYHYGCDGFDDKGWGCGYRTLQLISSWIANQLPERSSSEVPSLPSIQELLVSMEDKPQSFLGSKDWIGTYEVCLVIEKLFDVPSKILHVKKDDKLIHILPDLKNHFENFKSPIMIGGDMDCSSKGVVGINCNAEDPSAPAHLLIVMKTVMKGKCFSHITPVKRKSKAALLDIGNDEYLRCFVSTVFKLSV
ncbi:probable Ufm1-specific protease 1 isoform X2 [Ischnura elegans]|uniref:probable Ufm1-specific protease 1 isoform X2 n=1 Tax=Ischnura elegans TaxID=197161 RepID=UPI001ED8BD91|nr:probable Ufm1-specific protease 1 isoform X2 [Ischnura elegans]